MGEGCRASFLPLPKVPSLSLPLSPVFWLALSSKRRSPRWSGGTCSGVGAALSWPPVTAVLVPGAGASSRGLVSRESSTWRRRSASSRRILSSASAPLQGLTPPIHRAPKEGADPRRTRRSRSRGNPRSSPSDPCHHPWAPPADNSAADPRRAHLGALSPLLTAPLQ